MLTTYSKCALANLMFHRARGFAGAAALIHRGGNDSSLAYIELHLLCQSIEIALKAILLRLDFDRYYPRLRKLGHRLPVLVNEVVAASGRRKPLRPALAKELEVVGRLYESQRLRYASDFDLFVNPHTIPTRRIGLSFLAMVK